MLIAGALLFASWQCDLPRVSGSEIADYQTSWGTFDDFSEGIVIESAQAKLEQRSPTSFMVMPDGAPYYSQFGLPGDMLWLVTQATRDARVAAHWLGVGYRLASALVLSAFIAWAAVSLGRLFAAILLGFFALADHAVLISDHVYWLLPLSLLPFVAPWLLFGRWGLHRRTFWQALGIHALLVFFRCLCGYEYITCFALAPLPALAYHWWLGLAPGKLHWKSPVLGLIAVLVASAGGFSCAVAAHIAKGALGDKMTPGEVVEKVAERATSRTKLRMDQNPQEVHEELKERSKVYRALDKWREGDANRAVMFMATYRYAEYARANAISLPGGFGVPFIAYALLFVSCALVYGLGRKRIQHLEVRRTWDALALSAVAACLATFSWWIAALNHMLHHPHINSITLLFAFFPGSLLFVAFTVQTCFGSRKK